ncbi:MAG: HYR domain-containing protein [Bacillota bacterium]
MRYSKALIQVLGRHAFKKLSTTCCCLLFLLMVISLAVSFCTQVVNAAEEPQGELHAVSPIRQQMKLSQPSSVVPGGRGFMLPQTVAAKDSSGKPLAGVPVTFEVSSNDLITAVMRGYNSRVITVLTDANGYASAANTYLSYLGEGYQVYSKYAGIIQTLQVKASVPGWNIITFNVEVGTVGSNIIDNTPPFITASAKDDTGNTYIAGTWTNRSVIVHYDAKDTISDIKSCTQDQIFQNEGADQISTGTAIDSANNSASVTFGPINIDKNAPVTTAAVTKPQYGIWNNGTVTVQLNAADSTSGVESIYYKLGEGAPIKTNGSSASTEISTEGATVVSYWAVDKAGNIETAKSITVNIDKTAPTMTIIHNPEKNEKGWNNSDVTVTLTAADLYSGVKEIHYKIGETGIEQTIQGGTASFSVNKEGITSITMWAVDNVGYTSNVETKEVKIDKTLPLIEAPADIIIEATDVKSPVDIGTAYVSDVSDYILTSNNPGSFPIGSTTVTWEARDTVGNVSYDIQVITVKDTTNPVLTIPKDMVVEATGIRTPVVIGQATATDIFEVTVTNNAPMDFPLGKTQVTWTAKDANGNTVTAVQNITVVDTIKPVLSIPANIVLEATDIRTPVQIGAATATDIFDVTVTNNAPADFCFPVGTTKVAWRAADANGNVAFAEQEIRVVDTTKPVLEIPQDITIEASAQRMSLVIGQATATDIFNVTITNDAPVDYPVGTTKVTWKATDANGNITSKVQYITVTDTTKPVLTVPKDVTAEATGVSTPVQIGTATAEDIFDTTVKHNAPEVFPIGTTVVTWTATDVNGNVTTAIQNITVVDTTKPLLWVPLDITLEATAVITPVNIGTATAKDIFSTTVDNNAPEGFPIGKTEVIWTATDVNGNTTSGIQNITIIDTTKPLLTLPKDITVEATEIMTPVTIGQAAATDIFKVTITNNDPVHYPVGTTEVIWTATDVNGNVSTGVQKITVVDTTKPLLSVPLDITVEADAVRTQVAIGNAEAIDIFKVTITNDAPADFPVGTTVVTWTAADANGNISTDKQNIIVVDTTKPVLTVPEDITTEATSVSTSVYLGQATATDIFEVTIINNSPDGFPLGKTVITWTAIDANGNISTKEQSITVVDTTAPVLTVPEDITVEATKVRSPVDIGMATATDIFGIEMITNDAPIDFPLGTTVVTWTAIDVNGNVSSKAQRITVVDTTKPVVIIVPGDITAEATGLMTPVDIGELVAEDIFEVIVTNDVPYIGEPIGTNVFYFPLGTTVITWNVTDENGNGASMTQRITIIDTTKPVLTVPEDITVEAMAIRTPVDIGLATATDIFVVTIDNDAPANFPIGTTVVTWTATDANGNVTIDTQNVTIIDTTKPVLTVPEDITVEATAIRTPVDIGLATATDIFDVEITNDAPVAFTIGTTVVTWTATDANGNVSTKEQRITVVDTTKPVLTVPEDIRVEATAVRTPVIIGQATATDIFEVKITNDAPVDFPIGTTVVTWTATDANGNVTIDTQNITIVDTTKPVLTVPEDITVEATANRTPVDIGQAAATDIFEVTIDNDAPVDFPIGTTVVTWIATDENGNVTTEVQNVTIIDTTKPVLTVPEDITVEATAVRTPVDIGIATATDIFEVTVVNDAPVDFPIGTTVVIWTATDANGNVSIKEQRITIVDTTKPVLIVPEDITVEATGIRTPVDIGQATATDIFEVTIDNDAPADFPIGTTVVTWTATDANGNVTIDTQNVTIIDTTKPVLTVPKDITVEATGIRTPVDIGQATATDIFDVTIDNDAPVDFPIGTVVVTWIATDANGNVTTEVQNVTIIDTTKPVLTIPNDITVEATAVRTPVTIGQATATDIFEVTVVNDAPADFPIGTTVVTWTATDANGNVTIDTQNVTIIDTTKPVLTVPEDITVEATAIRTPVDIGQATATDIFEVTIDNDAPADFPIGTTVVTWTATDANGNVSIKEQRITIVDTTKPVLTVPNDITVEATGIRTPVDIGQATAADIFEVTIDNDAPVDFPIGTIVVTWTATDANGNVTIDTQNVTIIDTTKPVLTVPEDITVEATAVRTPVDIGIATATDIFEVTITNDAPVDFPIGTTIVTWTATDANGNVITEVQNVTIVDTTKPVLTIPNDITVEATAVRTPVDIGIPSATDIFEVTITNDAPADFPIGTTVVTWTAADANGNVTTKIQSITVVDTTKPVLIVPEDITVGAVGPRTPLSIGTATAMDIFEVTITNDAPVDFPIGTTVVTWTATDANGNVTTAVQNVTVIQKGKLKLKAYNSDRRYRTNSIKPYIKLENVGDSAINLSDVKIRYYYTVDGERKQNYWCDHAALNNPNSYKSISSSVKGTPIKYDNMSDCDYYIEISFSSDAGTLEPGGTVIIQSRFAKEDWSIYYQTNDYSFDRRSLNYADNDNITVYISDVLVGGTEPQ